LARIESGKPTVPKPRAITDKNPWWNKAWRHTSIDPQVVEPYAIRLDENGNEISSSTDAAPAPAPAPSSSSSSSSATEKAKEAEN